ncbi:MAG: prolyl oligopeptidase family serine peptidase [Gemmatimonadota bacterium]|nr:prolyl oligopeptidase family serine peptidase [Gemmatimonadota bacterium]
MTHIRQQLPWRLIAPVALGVLIFSARTMAAAAQDSAVLHSPPAAKVRPVTDDYFGSKVVDDYRYFEKLKDPEVQRWMKAQAEYTRQTLDSLPGYPALLKRIIELDESRPAQVSDLQIVAGRYYSLRTPASSQSAKLYVRDGINGTDHLLVDPEKLSADTRTHFSIGDFRPSPDGRYVAYLLAAGGSGESVLHVLDAQAGRDLAETADRALSDPYWRADVKSFFYTREQKLAPGMPKPAEEENSRVYLHVIGRAFDNDPPILGRGVSDASIAMTPVEAAEVVTRPGSRFAVAFVVPGTDTRLRVYAALVDSIHDGTTAWRPIAPSYDDQYIGGDDAGTRVIALSGDTLYWLSRKVAPRGDILKLDLARAASKPESDVRQGDLPISAVYAGRDAIYWRVSDAGVNSIRRLRFTPGSKPETLSLPYAANISDVHSDPLSSATVIQAWSWLRSPTYLSVEAMTGATAISDLQPAGPYDRPDDLAVDEVKVKSWDGTLVPLSIIHKKGIKLDGTHRALIQGYGAYGISRSPFYAPRIHIWYDRDGVFAVAHVRGGGELGEAWHKAGFRQTKPNSWKDFIACAEYLIAKGYTSSAHLGGDGASAGGIVIGRAIEERPDLFAAAIAQVPVADNLRFETTAGGPYNVPEFGSVKTPEGFKALYAMSSYAHVKDNVKYPAMLVTTGINDPRVAAWIPAKFAARLQAATASGKPVLLRVDYDAGHGLGATMQQSELDFADRLSFALWQTGDPDFQPKH